MALRPPNIEKGYYADDDHGILYVPILKAASRSVQEAVKPWHREVGHEEAVAISADYYSVAVIRHPWDRIVSALYGPLRSFAPFAERVSEHILGREPRYIDSHVRPQAYILRGLWVDTFIRVDRIYSDWAELCQRWPHLGPIPHKHKGVARPEGWRGEYDWDRLLPLYEEDFKLCLDWER